jgi:hypothetical protein
MKNKLLFNNPTNAIIAVCWALIILIKFVLRPIYFNDPNFSLLLGIGPNFLASFSGIFIAHKLLQYSFWFNFNVPIKIALLVWWLVAILNEVLQLIPLFGRTFDWLDMLASMFAIPFSYWAYTKIESRPIEFV